MELPDGRQQGQDRGQGAEDEHGQRAEPQRHHELRADEVAAQQLPDGGALLHLLDRPDRAGDALALGEHHPDAGAARLRRRRADDRDVARGRSARGATVRARSDARCTEDPHEPGGRRPRSRLIIGPSTGGMAWSVDRRVRGGARRGPVPCRATSCPWTWRRVGRPPGSFGVVRPRPQPRDGRRPRRADGRGVGGGGAPVRCGGGSCDGLGSGVVGGSGLGVGGRGLIDRSGGRDHRLGVGGLLTGGCGDPAGDDRSARRAAAVDRRRRVIPAGDDRAARAGFGGVRQRRRGRPAGAEAAAGAVAAAGQWRTAGRSARGPVAERPVRHVGGTRRRGATGASPRLGGPQPRPDRRACRRRSGAAGAAAGPAERQSGWTQRELGGLAVATSMCAAGRAAETYSVVEPGARDPTSPDPRVPDVGRFRARWSRAPVPPRAPRARAASAAGVAARRGARAGLGSTGSPPSGAGSPRAPTASRRPARTGAGSGSPSQPLRRRAPATPTTAAAGVDVSAHGSVSPRRASGVTRCASAGPHPGHALVTVGSTPASSRGPGGPSARGCADGSRAAPRSPVRCRPARRSPIRTAAAR